MNANPKKVKLVLFSAIALAVVLFVCSIALTVLINIKQQQIDKQNIEITELENKLKGHEENSLDKGDIEIVEKGE